MRNISNKKYISSEIKSKILSIKYKEDSYNKLNLSRINNFEHKLINIEEIENKNKLKAYNISENIKNITFKDLKGNQKDKTSRNYLRCCKKNKQNSNFIIYPDETFKKFWDFIIFFLLMYTAVILPYTVCFVESEIFSAIGIAETVIDFLFLVDLILNFFSAYLNELGMIVDDHKEIVTNYISGYFIFDFLSSIPIQLIINYAQSSINNRKFGLARFYKILRLTRLIKMFRVKKYDRILTYFFSHFNLNISYSKIIFMFIMTFLIVHITSCFWFFLNKIEDYNHGWIFNNNFQDKSDFELYLISFYWSCYTLFTIGFGDIKPSSTVEKIVVIMWIVYGAFFYSYTFGNLKTIIQSFDRKQVIINSKLKKIEDFSEKLNVSLSLTERIKSFFSHKFQKNLLYDNDNLLLELSDKLINKIIKTVFYEIIKNYDILKDTPIRFVNEFILNLKPLFIKEANSTLYEYGKFTEEVYYNICGKISFFSEDKSLVLIYSCFTYFGEVEVLFDEPRLFHAITRESCEMLFISKQNYISILLKYPKIFEMEIYKAYKRREFYFKRISYLRKRNPTISPVKKKIKKANTKFISPNRCLTKVDERKNALDVLKDLEKDSMFKIDLTELKDLKNNIYKTIREIQEKIEDVNQNIKNIVKNNI